MLARALEPRARRWREASVSACIVAHDNARPKPPARTPPSPSRKGPGGGDAGLGGRNPPEQRPPDPRVTATEEAAERALSRHNAPPVSVRWTGERGLKAEGGTPTSDPKTELADQRAL